MKPLADPMVQTMTLVMNGLTDNRNFKSEDVGQYSQDATNVAELVGAGTACKLEAAGMEPRFGSAAAFVDGKVGTFLFFNTTFSILRYVRIRSPGHILFFFLVPECKKAGKFFKNRKTKIQVNSLEQ